MDFVRDVFKDHDPDAPIEPDDTPLEAAKFDNLSAGIEEGITKAEAALSTLNAPQVVSNWKLSNTVKLRASLAKATLGTGYSTHVVIGDSLSSAYNGSGAFDFPNSWWRKLWRALVISGVPSAGTGRVAITDDDPSDDVGSPIDPHDPRITITGGWTSTSSHTDSAGSGDTITFTSDVAGEIVDVLYLDHGDSGGTFTVAIDGGEPVAVAMNPTWERKTYTVTGLANTTHTITVTATDANAIIMGFQVRHASGVRFDNLGVKYGMAAYWWDTSPDDLGPGRLTQTYSADADVIHIVLGSNDLTNGGPDGYVDGLTSIESIRGKFPDADCILYIEPSVDNSPDYEAYVAGMRALSVSLDVPLIDLSLRYGTYEQIAAAQLFGADGVHFNPVGQADWAGVALDALRSVGPNLLA